MYVIIIRQRWEFIDASNIKSKYFIKNVYKSPVEFQEKQNFIFIAYRNW